MTKPNPKKQREILDQDYVSRQDLRDLYGWSKSQAKLEFISIQHELEAQGKRLMNRGRTLMIPIDLILERFPLSYQRINRSANRMEENK